LRGWLKNVVCLLFCDAEFAVFMGKKLSGNEAIEKRTGKVKDLHLYIYVHTGAPTQTHTHTHMA
jgi:hypothetical protein